MGVSKDEHISVIIMIMVSVRMVEFQLGCVGFSKDGQVSVRIGWFQ